MDETWQSLKDTFSLSVLANPIEASKGDGEMATGAMGVMGEKFGSAAAAYSYLIFVLLYVPCISVMGAIARESSRGWMSFSILWGLNYRLLSVDAVLSDGQLQRAPDLQPGVHFSGHPV